MNFGKQKCRSKSSYIEVYAKRFLKICFIPGSRYEKKKKLFNIKNVWCFIFTESSETDSASIKSEAPKIEIGNTDNQ